MNMPRHATGKVYTTLAGRGNGGMCVVAPQGAAPGTALSGVPCLGSAAAETSFELVSIGR